MWRFSGEIAEDAFVWGCLSLRREGRYLSNVVWYRNFAKAFRIGFANTLILEIGYLLVYRPYHLFGHLLLILLRKGSEIVPNGL